MGKRGKHHRRVRERGGKEARKQGNKVERPGTCHVCHSQGCSSVGYRHANIHLPHPGNPRKHRDDDNRPQPPCRLTSPPLHALSLLLRLLSRACTPSRASQASLPPLRGLRPTHTTRAQASPFPCLPRLHAVGARPCQTVRPHPPRPDCLSTSHSSSPRSLLQYRASPPSLAGPREAPRLMINAYMSPPAPSRYPELPMLRR